MNKFIGGEEKAVNIGDPVVFENNTNSNYEVSAGIVFHTSGIYEVSIVGNRTIVSMVERDLDQEVEKVSDADRILKILESAKDKNGDVPMSLVRKAFDKL